MPPKYPDLTPQERAIVREMARTNKQADVARNLGLPTGSVARTLSRPRVKSALSQEISAFFRGKALPLAQKAIEDLLGPGTPANARLGAAKFVVQQTMALEQEEQTDKEDYELSAAEVQKRIDEYEMRKAREEAIDLTPAEGIFG